MNPNTFKNRYNIEARVNQEVIQINREVKTITVRDLLTEQTYDESYDKLVLSPGASPIKPPLEGINNPNVFTVRNVVDIEKNMSFVNLTIVKNIVKLI